MAENRQIPNIRLHSWIFSNWIYVCVNSWRIAEYRISMFSHKLTSNGENWFLKPKPHICKFSENSRDNWTRIGEQVMCGSVYLNILAICHYALNTFSAFPNLLNRRILVNTVCESQFSRLLVNLCEDARECWQIFGIRLFLENWPTCGYLLILADSANF